MKLYNLLMLAMTLFCLHGCATVKFYQDKDLKVETGIEFYGPKPYLLVERNPAKGVSIKTTIIYLPDLKNPKFAKIKPGIGSTDLQLDLKNGIINSYGITADTKVPETITSIAGLLSATTGLLKSEAGEAGEVSDEEVDQAGSISDMDSAKKIVDDVKSGIGTDKNNAQLTPNQKAIGSTIENDLSAVSQTLNRRNIVDIPTIGKKN